jgi:hypothetical protein
MRNTKGKNKNPIYQLFMLILILIIIMKERKIIIKIWGKKI